MCMCCGADDDQEGVMDNLLEALKTGSAFNVGRDRKDARRRAPRAAGGPPIALSSPICRELITDSSLFCIAAGSWISQSVDQEICRVVRVLESFRDPLCWEEAEDYQ